MKANHVYVYSPLTRSSSDVTLTLNSDEHNLSSELCNAFLHPPRGVDFEFLRDSEASNYFEQIRLAKLMAGARDCEFCLILLKGILEFFEDWKPRWDKYRWIENQFVRYRRIIDDFPDQFPDVAVDPEILIVSIFFSRAPRYVKLTLMVPPITNSGVGRKESFWNLDYYSDLGK